MNFTSIPDLIRVKIFLLLPSDSLHKCRQVCRGWNNFILENIWNSNYGRKQLEDQLDRNWGATSEVLKYELSSEVFDSGFKHSDIFAAFGDHLVIGKQPYGDDFPAIVILNVITKDMWQVTMEKSVGLRCGMVGGFVVTWGGWVCNLIGTDACARVCWILALVTFSIWVPNSIAWQREGSG